ncbi:MAG: DNA-processing protein DprA [Christensenellales bacterium]
MYKYGLNTLGLLVLDYAEGTKEVKNDLLRRFTPECIFKCNFGDFNSPLTNSVKILVENVNYLLDELDKKQIKLLSIFDEEYPTSLKNIDNSPKLLYLKGNADLLNTPCIAVVGTRKPTRYGIKVTEDFVREFALNGLTVVSGMARGLDTVAHKTCIELEKPTIAVFGSGVEVCYPAENRWLYDAILKSGGLLVSEYKPDVKPLQFHFPERNRIICGLSNGVFIAEASLKSGSIISARLAVEQGKELFVVPGNVNSEASMGTNALIKEMQGAITLSPSDVLETLNVKIAKPIERETVQLSFYAQKAVEALYEGELHFEELLSKVDVSASELTSLLTELEIMGIVVRLAGNYYALA